MKDSSRQSHVGNTRRRREISSKLTIKAPEWRYWLRSGVFTVNFEHMCHLALVFLLQILNIKMPAGMKHETVKSRSVLRRQIEGRGLNKFKSMITPYMNAAAIERG